LVFASVKNGRVSQIWKDQDPITEVNPRDDLIAYELFIDQSDENSQVVELNFFKQVEIQKNKRVLTETDILRLSQPRLMAFGSKTTITEM